MFTKQSVKNHGREHGNALALSGARVSNAGVVTVLRGPSRTAEPAATSG